MLHTENTTIGLVSEKDFRIEIDTIEDVTLNNLKNNVYDKIKNSDIVMFIGNSVTTVILKNRYGHTGMVVE